MSKTGVFRVLLGIFLSTTAVATAWSQRTKGKVYEETGTYELKHVPMPGAHVRVLHGDQIAVTDAFGVFELEGLAIGDTVEASMVGYEPSGWVWEGERFIELVLRPGVVLGAAEVVADQRASSLSLMNALNVQTLNRAELVKAACCNLSEAFETNASVDASFTDAVTGTRQIRMLGLDGKYTQLLVDNLPGPRGLAVVQGLLLIPGDWVNSIAISKGAGAVSGGYESITGQINVAHKNPMNADPFHANLYLNGAGRMEWNHVSTHAVSRRWKTAVLSHALYNGRVNDRNGDGFLDTPLQRHLVLRNEWKFTGDRGIRGEYAVSGATTELVTGMADGVADEAVWSQLDAWQASDGMQGVWRGTSFIERAEASAKTGYVFPGAAWRSIGSQFNALHHRTWHNMGGNRYDGTERMFRGNILYAGRLAPEYHTFTAGASYVYNDFNESAEWADSAAVNWSRTERVPGAFFEYTFDDERRWNVVAGLRADAHNLYGRFVSPRLHARFSVTDALSLKASAGRGLRVPNPLMEQLGPWASRRTWLTWQGDQVAPLQLLDIRPEQATNVGLNATAAFKLNHRDASLAFDAYWTEFTNRLVVDMDYDPSKILLYNLEGVSRSKTAQVEFDWSAHRRFDVRLAYRYVDAVTDRRQPDYRRDPFVSRHRGFGQISYASRTTEQGSQWRVDATLQWVGAQRLPSTAANPEPFQQPEVAPDFTQFNLQASRDFSRNASAYLGIENVMNVRQERPIIAATADEGDFNDYFDASLVYGPIFGRMVYAGLRWRIASPDSKGGSF